MFRVEEIIYGRNSKLEKNGFSFHGEIQDRVEWIREILGEL